MNSVYRNVQLFARPTRLYGIQWLGMDICDTETLPRTASCAHNALISSTCSIFSPFQFRATLTISNFDTPKSEPSCSHQFDLVLSKRATKHSLIRQNMRSINSIPVVKGCRASGPKSSTCQSLQNYSQILRQSRIDLLYDQTNLRKQLPVESK